MNERQKKIMVPYEEKTDTCPDCSNHPCDCRMPAGYEVDIRFAANFAPHIKVMEASKVAEIIEQRDRLAEALQKNLVTTWLDEIEFEVFKGAISALKGETDDR